MTTPEAFRETIQRRLQNHSDTLLIVTGPCSIYNEEETLAYARLLGSLQKEIGDSIFLVMRAFVEKSRTSHAWRGFVYKKATDAEENIIEGINRTRDLFKKLSVPLAMECIDPMIFPYLQEYISWGFIGARTSTSTTHRIFASEYDIPFGFKNGLDGDISAAANGCNVASHSHMILTGEGQQKETQGNRFTHVVLRGGKDGTNYDRESVDVSLALLKKHGLNPPVLVDCSHGNCPDKPGDQKKCFKEALSQYLENPKKVCGMMLESNLLHGAEKEFKVPGVSYTDPCLSFEETKELILDAAHQIKLRRHKAGLASPTSYVYNR